MTRDEKTGVAVGGIAGFLLWILDSKHIILGGAPHTPVADFIRRFIPLESICDIRIEGVNVVCGFFTTLLILVFTGMFIGYTAVGIKQSFVNRKKSSSTR